MRKLILTFAVTLTAALYLSAQISLPLVGSRKESPAAKKLVAAENYIQEYYVDDVNADSLVEEAIRAMLHTLDPHSNYNTVEETRALEEPLQGNFSGIGITFNMATDTVFVTQTVPGGPAARLGMQPGDRIIRVNDTVIAGVKMNTNDVKKLIRGPKGSVVKITVKRPGEKKNMEFKVKRDDIPIYSVEASYMVDPETGYIRITRFAEDTPAEVEKAIKELSAKGMKNLMIDLQENGGGYLNSATEIAKMFLHGGDQIVYTQNSRSMPRYYVSDTNGKMTRGRLVVLVDQYSASASEILSGALQDNDRGVIVGRRTFGKGLVQRPFRFSDGSMMRLTISRYYTPSGRCIQKPYVKGDESSYKEDIRDRYDSGELMNADSIHFDESQLFHTRAGRPVYGGGGIMPDHFVPLDTTRVTKYYRDLSSKAVLVKYANNFIEKHGAKNLKGEGKKGKNSQVASYPTEDVFIEQFEVTPDMLEEIKALGEREGVEFDKEQFDKSVDYISGVVKALIGRDLFSQQTYFRVINNFNPIFKEAYNVISNPKEYDALLTPTNTAE